MSCWALIALKTFACGKSRLAQVLSLAQRESFSRTMLEHVVRSLAAAHEIDGIAIVTQERAALPAAALALHDPGGGLNAALASGARQLGAAGANELLVLHADLPLLAADEIDESYEVVTTPDTVTYRRRTITEFEAELHPAVAANPFLSFPLLVTGAGTLTLTWEGDNGFAQTETLPLRVA